MKLKNKECNNNKKSSKLMTPKLIFLFKPNKKFLALTTSMSKHSGALTTSLTVSS